MNKPLFPKNKITLYDGSKGVMLQEAGLQGHEAAEEWNLSHPEAVKKVYQSYINAGSEAIQTNTFPGNTVTLGKHGLGEKAYELNFEGVRLAKEAAGENTLVGASAGPTGEFLEPAGTLTFEDAVKAFTPSLTAVQDAGADFVSFETFTDLQELRAAIIAEKEVCGLPFVASLSFESGGRTLTGNTAEACAIVCQSLGAEIVGANCSGGPDSLTEPVQRMYSVSSVPLLVKPNAGMPKMVDGKQIYESRPEDFNRCVEAYVSNGVRLIGGCCGSNPRHIESLRRRLAEEPVPALCLKPQRFICSAHTYLDPVESEGETIAMARFAGELEAGGWDSLLDELLDGEGDYFVLDFTGVNQRLPLWDALSNISISVRQPLAIKTENAGILRDFLRYYPGRAGVAAHSPELQEMTGFYGALKMDI